MLKVSKGLTRMWLVQILVYNTPPSAWVIMYCSASRHGQIFNIFNLNSTLSVKASTSKVKNVLVWNTNDGLYYYKTEIVFDHRSIIHRLAYRFNWNILLYWLVHYRMFVLLNNFKIKIIKSFFRFECLL